MTSNRQINNESIHVQIRKGVLNDIPFIKKCLLSSWIEHARNNPDLMTEEKMKNSRIEDYYEKALEQENGYIFVAETDGKKVGLIRAYEEKIASFFIDNKIIYIDDIYVVEDFRRKGIARKLILEIEIIARQRSIKRIDGRIYSYNLPIQNLLNSMGYRPPYATWVKILK